MNAKAETTRTANGEVLLDVRGLGAVLHTHDAVVEALGGVDLVLHAGESVAVVGESGSGKSTLVLSILRLFAPGVRAELSGAVEFGGHDLVRASEAHMRSVRGRDIAAVFQEPLSALNPVLRIGDQVVEAVRVRDRLSKSAARARAVELLERVRFRDPTRVVDLYPHQCSGGMRQRALLAMALACGPRILLADEPTSALDKTLEVEISALVRDLARTSGMAVLWITHDLTTAARVADRVVVMYAGRVVEDARTDELGARPLHPYTKGLLETRAVKRRRGERFGAIPGQVPDARAWPSGCRFRTRCPIVRAECAELPRDALERTVACASDGSAHRVACPFAAGVASS